jgi:hypothetical protein
MTESCDLVIHPKWGEPIMTNRLNIYSVENERRKDMLRDAEQRRLIRMALANDHGHVRLYTSMMAWTGRSLVTWGYWLLSRTGQHQSELKTWVYEPEFISPQMK